MIPGADGVCVVDVAAGADAACVCVCGTGIGGGGAGEELDCGVFDDCGGGVEEDEEVVGLAGG